MKNRLTIIVTAMVVVVVIVFFGIYSKNKSQIKQVKASIVKKGDIKAYLSTTAILKSKNSKEYYPSQLKIQKINVSVGDKVKNGQNLITYDLTDLNTQAKQAQLQYNNALLQKQEIVSQRNSVNSKSSDLDARIQEAEKSNDPSVKAALPALKQQRDSIQPISDAKIQELDNSAELAKASLDAANSKLNSVKTGVVSQIDGVVTALNGVEGAVANPSQPIVIVQDLNNLKAVVFLGKYDADKVLVGQEAVVRSSGRSYNGKVAFINPAAVKSLTPGTNDTTLAADIDILDKPENLKIDFDVDVDILTAFKGNVMKIPVEAIKTDKSGKSSVFIINGGKANKKEIKIGVKSDIEVEVTEGLTEKDKVILNPSAAIGEGSKVKETL